MNLNSARMEKLRRSRSLNDVLGIGKEVGKLFNVKVKDVKVLNMPEKRRDFGKHPGAKSGFKKAIVILEKGQKIAGIGLHSKCFCR